MSYVLFDVDGCLLDEAGRCIPGMNTILELVRLNGMQVRIWSAGGAVWAAEAANRHNVDPEACYRKTDYPPTRSDALALLGHPPMMQVDDDPTEAVEGFPFMTTEEALRLLQEPSTKALTR